MRVFLGAPAADRMIVAPEGHGPGATPRLASARRQPGQRSPTGCWTGDSLGNSTGNTVGNITGKSALPEVLPAGYSGLTLDSQRSKVKKEQRWDQFCSSYSQLFPQAFQVGKLKDFVICWPQFEVELLIFP